MIGAVCVFALIACAPVYRTEAIDVDLRIVDVLAAVQSGAPPATPTAGAITEATSQCDRILPGSRPTFVEFQRVRNPKPNNIWRYATYRFRCE